MDDKNNNSPEEPKVEDVTPAENPAEAALAPETPEEENANPFAALKVEAEESSEMKDEDAAEEAIEEPEVEVPEIAAESAVAEETASSSEDESKEETKSAEDSEAVEEPSEEEKEEEKPVVPANPNARWYVVHTFAGHENKVATALRQRIEAEHLENLIYDILVPTQDKIEIKGGKKETVKEKIFPGYILIKMELSDLSWLAVRTTQGVTSFIGAGNKPTPISEAEVASIVKFTTQGASPTFKDVFMVDDTVKIVDGPFAEFIGKVDSVDKEKGRVRVLVSIFGRETPVELDFLQVQKL
jgi:transcriptional antiterminator NusG